MNVMSQVWFRQGCNEIACRVFVGMFETLSLAWLAGVGVAAAGVIFLCGLRMTTLADMIADRTGLGEAMIGGILLGAATSFSGVIVSLTAALDGRASLAFSNAIGGIAAQTAFLAIADTIYRKANLEHAAAELANIYQCGTLLLLLSVPMVAFTSTEFSVLGLHPASVMLFLIYAYGVRTTSHLRDDPMWEPVETDETRADTPDGTDDGGQSTVLLFTIFFGLMLALGLAGWTIANIAAVITDRFGIGSSVVGALMTAVVTSLPELVTTVAAVRRGALQLAVGGIIGGNTFDILFLTVADAGFREGSLYHAIGRDDLFWLAVSLVMTAILLLGLLYRQKQGPGGIGWESISLLAIYAGAIVMQAAL